MKTPRIPLRQQVSALRELIAGHSDDLVALNRFIEDLFELIESQMLDVERLEHQLGLLRRRYFGRKSEKLDPRQLLLFLSNSGAAGTEPVESGAEPESQPQPEPAPELKPEMGNPRRKRGSRGLKSLPPELPRERVEHEIKAADRICPCCQAEKTKISEEVSEQLEYRPASLLVLQHVRSIYACKRCQEGVVVADKPSQPIEKGLPGPGLLAQVCVSKFADHLPLYRQERIFERFGVELSRSTLCGWVRETAKLVTPLWRAMLADVLRGAVIQADETKIPVQDPGQGKVHNGWMWVYLGDGAHKHVVFDYTRTRNRDGPAERLGGYKGYLQCDGCSVYDAFCGEGLATRVGCMAHVRRKIYEARPSSPIRADRLLKLISELYQIESEGRLLTPTEIRGFRRAKSRPILDSLRAELDEAAGSMWPKNPLREAIGYALGQWPHLVRYLEDGRLSIDNNGAERALRGLAIGRKNWQFVGHDQAGDYAAIHFSLIESCKRNGVEPFSYLSDLFARIPSHPVSRVLELAPANWQASR